MSGTANNSVKTINGIDLSIADTRTISFRQFTDAELNALRVASVNTAIYYNSGNNIISLDNLETLQNGLSVVDQTLVGALTGAYQGFEVFGLPASVGGTLFGGGVNFVNGIRDFIAGEITQDERQQNLSVIRDRVDAELTRRADDPHFFIHNGLDLDLPADNYNGILGDDILPGTQRFDINGNPFYETLRDKWNAYIDANHSGHCFPASTLISLADETTTDIEFIRPGDMVLAFDPTEDNGCGGLVPCKVTRLFHNSTEEWIELSNGLTVTPGHHFLDAQGGFRTIEDILATDGTIVLEDGSLQKVTGKRLRYSGETASLYEQAEAQIATRGALALAPVAPGWQTYNFEVEGLHTYVAGGVRVHNRSTIGEHIVNDLELAALEAIFGDDIRSIELPDGSGGGVQLV